MPFSAVILSLAQGEDCFLQGFAQVLASFHIGHVWAGILDIVFPCLFPEAYFLSKFGECFFILSSVYMDAFIPKREGANGPICTFY